jgi:hypothetical protein
MITLNFNYEVLQDRLVTIKLPEEVPSGRHDLVIVLDEKESGKKPGNSDSRKLMLYSKAVAAFNNIDGVAYQRKLRSEWS